MINPKHILITGTTSGIGQGIMKHYVSQGWKVTAFNRRKDENLEKQYPQVEFKLIDVRDVPAIKKYFEEASKTGLPSMYFLGAGINKVDNVGGFSLETFREVTEINLFGVLNVLSEALPRLQGAEKEPVTFICASSTTNIFANPNCLSYYVTKFAVYKIFQMMGQAYKGRGIAFKSIVLGPVATNIFVSGKLASKMQAMARDIIMVTVDDAIPKIVKFIHSSCKVFYYPKPAVLLFTALRLVTTFYPGFYKGSAPE